MKTYITPLATVLFLEETDVIRVSAISGNTPDDSDKDNIGGAPNGWPKN